MHRNWFWFFILIKTGTVKSKRRGYTPALLGQCCAPDFSHSLSLCHTKFLLFNIQVDLQIAILYEALSLWPWPSTFSSGPRIHLQMKPRGVQLCPTERQDGFPLFTQHGSSGIVGTAWPAHLGLLKADPV